MHDYDKIAAIVGEDKIEALRKIGVDIGNKPDKPTTGLLGRWVKDLNGKDMVICNDKPDGSGLLVTAWVDPRNVRGTGSFVKNIDELTFPEETTRPEDTPVGEAWLVNVGERTIPVVKTLADNWYSGELAFVSNEYVTLIAPLVPARPVDNDREHTLETVTTKDEYAALPEGSIVAEAHSWPYRKMFDGMWRDGVAQYTNLDMAGVTRQVLRKGWGE